VRTARVVTEPPADTIMMPWHGTWTLSAMIEGGTTMRITPFACAAAAIMLASAASAQIRTNDAPGTRNPTGDRPQLSENASGAEASLVVQVKQQLQTDQQLRGENIKVEGDEERRITLTGTVATDAQKQQAERVARGVANVQYVENKIAVASGARRPLEREGGMTMQGKPAEPDRSR
jgi:hypothetical protein